MDWVDAQLRAVTYPFVADAITHADDWAYAINRSEQSFALSMNHMRHYQKLGWIYPHSQADAFRVVGQSGSRRIIPVYFRKKLVKRVAAKLVGRAVPGLGWALLIHDAWHVGKWIGEKTNPFDS